MIRFFAITSAILFTASASSSAAPKSRDQQVIDDRDTMEKNDHWIYNDLAKAKQLASGSGKPMMVVFRCIP